MIYLTTFMLGNIFSEKIACHNASYKELREKAFIEVGESVSHFEYLIELIN